MTREECREQLLDIMDYIMGSMSDYIGGDWIDALGYAIDIIDKHKEESEEKE